MPKCNHGEPAEKKRVNKAGPNQGRYFWRCARPAGPKPHGECNFFKRVCICMARPAKHGACLLAQSRDARQRAALAGSWPMLAFQGALCPPPLLQVGGEAGGGPSSPHAGRRQQRRQQKRRQQLQQRRREQQAAEDVSGTLSAIQALLCCTQAVHAQRLASGLAKLWAQRRGRAC